MQDSQRSEHYTDKLNLAVMTRTRVVTSAQLVKIADRLSRNAQYLATIGDSPGVNSCRIAGVMLGWAYNPAPLRLGTKFDE